MKLLDDYNALRQQIFDYFGYREDWRVFPLDDCRSCYWLLDGTGPGTVRYANTIDVLNDEDAGQYHENEIYTQRHLPKWVYRGAEFTLIVVDTNTDGNQFLSIFDNAKEQKD